MRETAIQGQSRLSVKLSIDAACMTFYCTQ